MNFDREITCENDAFQKAADDFWNDSMRFKIAAELEFHATRPEVVAAYHDIVDSRAEEDDYTAFVMRCGRLFIPMHMHHLVFLYLLENES